MSSTQIRHIEDTHDRRQATNALVGNYHEQQLRLLLEHVREGFRRMDAGEIDPFELDEIIYTYKRSAQKLWSFCSDTDRAARAVQWRRYQAEPEPDWWGAGQRRRRRR
jgi:hypothetical protein